MCWFRLYHVQSTYIANPPIHLKVGKIGQVGTETGREKYLMLNSWHQLNCVCLVWLNYYSKI